MNFNNTINHFSLSHESIEQICFNYFQKGFLKSYEKCGRGSCNATYKVHWEDKWYMLKFYLRNAALAAIEKDTCSLIEKKVSTPSFYYLSHDSIPYGIFEFCSGIHLDEVENSHSEKLSYDLGKTLAAIHSFQFPHAGLLGKNFSIQTSFPTGSTPYLECCQECLVPDSKAWKRLGEERSKAMLQFLDVNAGYFSTIHNGGCLVHSDYRPANLLWGEKEGVTVLDWEFVHIGDPMIDFGILLRHFRTFPFSVSTLEKGYYDGGGKLPTDWIKRARIIDFINVIQILDRPTEGSLKPFLIESVDFTMKNWKTIDSMIKVAQI